LPPLSQPRLPYDVSYVLFLHLRWASVWQTGAF
jgi:hypothetical protein